MSRMRQTIGLLIIKPTSTKVYEEPPQYEMGLKMRLSVLILWYGDVVRRDIILSIALFLYLKTVANLSINSITSSTSSFF
tara:strand:+ start:425 stop:664 length:240 start_codon:yes stop_codon:yes gene_type:complete